MSELHEHSAVELRRRLAHGALTAVELTEHYLDRIERLNPRLRAFLTVTPDAARERAERLDAARQQGDRSHAQLQEHPLWGMPFGDKDLIDRAGVRSTYGSRAMLDHIPDMSHPLVTSMDAAGGISLGKTNTPEFGFPSYTENRVFADETDTEGRPAVARNPWDDTLGPGGSSGGAAVAVAAQMLPFAPGTDGGGSIRIPAAACGLVGLKPSRGRVPDATGQDALAGLTVAGPIARSVSDAALLLDGMIAQADHAYALRAPAAPGSYLDVLAEPVRSLRIGVNTWSPWADHYAIDIDNEAMTAFETAVQLSRRLGHRIEDVQPRPFPEWFDAFRTVWQSGAASLPVHGETLEQVEPLTRWLIETGRERRAGDLVTALDALSRFERQIIADYAAYDVVLTPALAMSPRPIGWYDSTDGERNFEQQCQYTPFTAYLNVAGLPAIALPVSYGDAAAAAGVFTGTASAVLPFGVQAIGRPGDESTLLQFGYQLERELRWCDRAPAGI